jgi:hypothetical protein
MKVETRAVGTDISDVREVLNDGEQCGEVWKA